MSEKLFIIFISLGIAIELLFLGWMVNNHLENKYREKVRAEKVGSGMSTEEVKEWQNKVMLNVIRAEEWKNRKSHKVQVKNENPIDSGIGKTTIVPVGGRMLVW